MTIPQNPRFKECFHVEVLSSDRVVAFNESEKYYLITGSIYPQIAPLLYPKPFSTSEIINRLDGKFTAPEVYYALMELEAKGLITETKEMFSKSVRSFCHLLGVSSNEAISRLNEMEISLYEVGRTSIKNFEKKLKKLFLKVGSQADLTAVVTDHYRRKELQEFGRVSLEKQKPWLLVKAVGSEVSIGPLFVPGKTGCFQCFSDRLKFNHIEERYIEKYGKSSTLAATNFATLPLAESLAYDLAANEIFKWIVKGSNEELEGKVISYDQLTSQVQKHQLIKRPQCCCCGEETQAQSLTPFALKSQNVEFFSDGGYRIISPEETYKKYQHHISPITGVVKSLTYSPNANPAMHAYFSVHTSSEIGHGNLSFDKLRMSSAGKGKTNAQSKASCLCEALERYSGHFSGDEKRKKGSYQSLKAEAIHPNSCLLFSESQYKNRNQLNKNADNFQRVFSMFDEKKEIDWSPTWSLTKQCWKWLPTSFCYYRYHDASDIDQASCIADSNGCASGNTKEEAILQGFLELIERDAIAIWWYNRLRVPGIDLSSFKDPYISRLISTYQSNNRDIWVLDITMDIQIPTFVAISKKKTPENEEIFFGFGSHFDHKIALFRALTELNQMYTNRYKALNKKEDSNRTMTEWLKTATTAKHPYLLPHPDKLFKNYTNQETAYFQDLKDAVLLCKKLIEEKGLEMLVQDQTRLDIGLSVVRVTVPGLRHFWGRYAPGRLYDVPVELGRLEKKLEEEELNPIPMFM